MTGPRRAARADAVERNSKAERYVRGSAKRLLGPKTDEHRNWCGPLSGTLLGKNSPGLSSEHRT